MLRDLLHDVSIFIRKYVVVSDEQQVVVTLFVTHTQTNEAADSTAYFQVTSVTAEAGKTRLLETLEPLVARPWLTGRTSAAALVRKVDAQHPTLLLDESDAAFNGEKEYAEALRGLLNTGYRRSGKCTLCVGQGASLTFRDFSTFCPKAIAGIGKLPDTVVSRAIRIELRRRTKDETVAKFRQRDAYAEADPLSCAIWSWANNGTVIATLKAMRPTMPKHLRDRAEDVLEPLVAIADLAGGDWPDRARRAAVALMGSTDEQDINVELLHDIAAVFVGDFMSSHDLVDKLVTLEDRPWREFKKGKPISTHALASRLKAFGIVPLPDKHGARRGYYRSSFVDAWTRYPRSE